MATCFHHPDRETGRSCTRCGRPACPECLRDAPVGSHCFECLRNAPPVVRYRPPKPGQSSAGPGARFTVTNVIIALNVAVFAVGVGMGSDIARGRGELARDLGLYGPFVSIDNEYWRLLTSGFLHFGFIHLAFNMFVLYRIGETLESGMGKLRFSALYLAALLAGSCGALVASPDALTAGASGAVYGLFGALALAWRSRGQSVWQSGIGPVIAINLLLTFTIPGISVGGHIGGLVGGGLCAVGLFGPSAMVGRQTGKRPTMLVGLLTCLAVAAVSVVGALVAASAAT